RAGTPGQRGQHPECRQDPPADGGAAHGDAEVEVEAEPLPEPAGSDLPPSFGPEEPPPSSLLARLRRLSLSDLKSVSYQPLPARRNDGAETRRFTPGRPQLGHSLGSGSDTFCRRSKPCPHS